MKRAILTLLVSALILPLIASAETKISGTLVDTKCYSMNHANKGNTHLTPKGRMPGCGSACAKMGIPVAILNREGMNVLITPAPQLADYIGKEARITGKRMEAGIIPTKIEVKTDRGWRQVNIGTMM